MLKKIARFKPDQPEFSLKFKLMLSLCKNDDKFVYNRNKAYLCTRFYITLVQVVVFNGE